MKVLMGIIHSGVAKNYVMLKFVEMLRVCIAPIDEIDIIWATDYPPEEAAEIFPGDAFYKMSQTFNYAEDMLMEGREAFRVLALEDGYDAMIWQGVDALWQSKQDVIKVLKHLENPMVPVVAPLISARADSKHAIARRFLSLNEDQVEIPSWELHSGRLIQSGFAGADNIILRRDTFDMSWEGKHIAWYERVAQGKPNICCEEWLLLNLLRRGQQPWLDTSTKVWHVHETGAPDGGPMANMYYGNSKPLSDLSWTL